MNEYVPAALRRLVVERAEEHCEYCLIHQDDALLPHEPDHVIAVKHHGKRLKRIWHGHVSFAIAPKEVISLR